MSSTPSLKDYCSQVYNPGSPNPNPEKSRSLSSSLPISAKLAANVRSAKRPLEKESPSGSPEQKTARIDKDVMKEVGEELFRQFLPKIEDMIHAAVEKLDEKIEKKIEEKMVPMKESIVDIERVQAEIDARIKDLEKNPPVRIDDIREKIVPQISADLKTSLDTQWRISLTEEIKKTECCLVIKGLEEKFHNREGFEKFCQNVIKMPEEDYKKVRIHNLSSSRGGKKGGSILFVTLGCPAERNIFFKYAKNASGNIKLEQHVPKNYLKKYREFQNDAWKLRVTDNYQTRIDFEGANLALRYKKKDTETQKYSWVISAEFCPKPEKPVSRTTFTPPEGCIPTPPIQNREIIAILSNIGHIEKDKITEIFTEGDRDQISSVEEKKVGIYVLHFKSEEKTLAAIRKYNGRVVNDRKISLVKL